jgi:hypothetical protein
LYVAKHVQCRRVPALNSRLHRSCATLVDQVLALRRPESA